MKSLELTEEEGMVAAAHEKGISFKDTGKQTGVSEEKTRNIHKRAQRKLAVQRRVEEYLKRKEPLEAAEEELLYRVPLFRFVTARFGAMRKVLLQKPGEIFGKGRIHRFGRGAVEEINAVLAQDHYKLHLGMTEEDLSRRGL